nr:prolyl oligopeptidase family serine peptidase [Armatimonas sp.]
MIPTLIDIPRRYSQPNFMIGIPILILTPTVGGWREPTDFNPSLLLFWDTDGLHVQVDVQDNLASEQPGTENLWQGDSVELFLGTKVGEAQYVQFLISSYSAKIVEADHRTKKRGPLQCQAKISKYGTGGGYRLTAVLGWEQLGIVPKLGQEIAFQIVVNDRDNSGAVNQSGLHPGGSAYNDPKKMIRLRLSEISSKGLAMLQVATEADYSHFPRTTLTLTAPWEKQNTAFAVRDSQGVLARGKFGSKSGRAVAEVTLSRAWVGTVTCGAETQRSPSPLLSPLLLEDVQGLRKNTLAEAKLSFSRFVFTEDRFPTPEISPRVEAAIGPFTLSTVFYDAEQKIITQPKTPGRYGAVTTLKSKSGLSRTFFTTLYKSPGSHDAWEKPNFFSGRIPEELGVAREISKQRQADIAAFLRDRFLAHLSDDPKSAILLAGLAECKPEEPTVARLSADARDNRWWFSLQQKLSATPRFRYATQLPAGYESDKNKRWPLLLFLHGSGEAGDNLDLVKVHGPWKLAKDFLIVAPQNPVDDWWRPEQVLTLVADLEKKYRLDNSRLYLTGLSLGGYGTWATALLAPKRFAAIVPICGAGDPADAARLTELPTWAFHGQKDDAVPVRHSQEMIAALRKSGATEARLTLYPEAGHDAWSATYANPTLYSWLLSHRRNSL